MGNTTNSIACFGTTAKQKTHKELFLPVSTAAIHPCSPPIQHPGDDDLQVGCDVVEDLALRYCQECETNYKWVWYEPTDRQRIQYVRRWTQKQTGTCTPLVLPLHHDVLHLLRPQRSIKTEWYSPRPIHSPFYYSEAWNKPTNKSVHTAKDRCASWWLMLLFFIRTNYNWKVTFHNKIEWLFINWTPSSIAKKDQLNPHSWLLNKAQFLLWT